MYAVSDRYLEAIHLAERYVDIKGRITFKNGAVVAVSNNTFQEASLYINKKAVDSDDLNAMWSYSWYEQNRCRKVTIRKYSSCDKP